MSIVSTKKAANLLGISQARGRIQDAEKIGNSWIIPLFDGMPVISQVDVLLSLK